MWQHFTLKPKPPYSITLHFRLFTLPGIPSHILYDDKGRVYRSLVLGRRGYEAVECVFSGEQTSP